MKTAHAAKTEWGAVSGHRSGGIDFKRLIQGEDGAPDNFEFSFVRTAGDYYTPRHRHNFDQVRFCIEGSMNYAPGKDLKAGTVGYFPEGSFYGPQKDSVGSVVLLLQMGGAAGFGFMSYQQLNAGYQKLSDLGHFDNGVFSRVAPDGATQRKDGYEAIWEYVNKRSVEYPAPRYEEPIVMHPENFGWRAIGGGFDYKHLGSFGERGLSLRSCATRKGISVAKGVHHGEPRLLAADGGLRTDHGGDPLSIAGSSVLAAALRLAGL